MRDSLTRFGYTPREANFLIHASLLSGYFLRRHFNSYIGRSSGALGQNFIGRGLALKHLRAIPAIGGRLIYHVAASAIYEALGEATSRNRREHQFETVRLRLMALDVSLLCSEVTWLLTEQEKVDYFARLGVPLGDLPQTVFGKCRRFFVEKYPLGLSRGGYPRFVFVDGAFCGFSQWELFLKAHRGLLHRLQAAELIFSSCHPERFETAERLFRRSIAGESVGGGFDLERLKRYFEARQAFEAKRLDLFDQSKLNQLREDKRVFVGEEVERLYSDWCRTGTVLAAGLKGCTTRFQTQVLTESYEWLSPIQFHERRA